MSYNILSVDAMGFTELELSGILRDMGISITSARDAKEAADILHGKRSSVCAILWSINRAGYQDFEAIKKMKSQDALRHIPVLIISALTDKSYIIKAIEAGAVEYIVKPYEPATVIKKICRILGVHINKTGGEEDNEDIITYNFTEMCSKEVKAAGRGGYPLSILLASIQPKPNAAAAASADNVLGLMNTVLRNKLRETDISFLYGQNHLIVILPFADKDGADTVEKKIHDILQNHTLIKKKCLDYQLQTASVTMPDDGKTKERLLEKLERKFNGEDGSR